jgi:hypothetical protein
MRKLIGLTAVIVFGGCSGSDTRLALNARSAPSALTVGSSPQRLAAGQGINLTRVRFVVERVKLEQVETDGGTDAGTDGGSDGGSGEFALGPFLVDLQGATLDSGITQVFQVNVPPGDYEKIKFRIHKLDGSDARFGQEMAGLSMILEGTIDAQSFTFTSSLDEEQEREGLFRIQSDQDNNITLAIDAAGWFLDGATRLDPRLAATDGSIRSIIESNIKASIDVFDDEDRDGRDDG